MFNKQLFILAHNIGCNSFLSDYKRFIKNQSKSYKKLKEIQEIELKHMVHFCYTNVPYYRTLFKSLQLQPKDVKSIEDLEKLPILTKDIIKKNWEDFKPVNLSRMKYYEQTTGGSTGTPFSYRLSKHDRFLSGALLYRGWGYGGYELGDKIVFLAGSSLYSDTKSKLITFINEKARNLKQMSSFDMGEEEMGKYVATINKFKPKYIRGYSSSLYFFSKWIDENNINIYSPKAVFTTAEKLHPHMRTTISNIFNCNVYDGYGLNDGGISAYECPEHAGLHIDTERSIMEVVDDRNYQLEKGMGKILSTSLYNYSMPFLRYLTGDMGHLIDNCCSCGREYPLLKEILGRTQNMLQTPEGKFIHGEYFTHIFWEVDNVREFQVIQENIDSITIHIVTENSFDDGQLNKVQNIINMKSPNWDIKFKIVDSIKRTDAGKYKFIINKMNDVQ